MSPIRIVIADDHAIVRQGLRAVIRGQPDMAVVGEASSGRDAVLLTLKQRPDLVLMDLVMPDMNGVAAIREIKGQAPEVSIVALTSLSETDQILGAVQAGADGYLLKEVELQELLAAIRAVRKGQPYLHRDATRHLLQAAGQPQVSPERLTEREQQVLMLVAHGCTNRQIAKKLLISEKTVSVHVSNILGKLHLESRTQAALYAVRTRLVLLTE